MRRQSIQHHLGVTVVLSQFLIAAGLVFVGVFYTQRALLSALDDAMRGHVMSLIALVRYTGDGSGNVYFDDALVPDSLDLAHPDMFAVWTETSGLLVRSKTWPPGLDISPGGRVQKGRAHWNFHWNGVSYRGLRVLRVPVLDRNKGNTSNPQTLTVVYGTPMVSLRAELHKSTVFLVLASALILAMSMVFALWGVRSGLVPLQNLAAEATLVSAQNWSFRIPDEAQQIQELQPLSEAIVRMLERLHWSFTQQKEFLGNAAHELKTPVAVLKSTLQSVSQCSRSGEDYQAGLERALEDLDRLETLLQGMLHLARAEQWAQGALRCDVALVDVAASCEEAVLRIRPLAETKDVKINLSTNGSDLLNADPEDLHMVWINLLANAVRYSRPGGPVEVSITRTDNHAVRVVFTDRGEGIAKADLPHIFDRFYRGDRSRTRATGGFGLGLAISRTLVEAYGGTIWADSEPGQGTRMTVELPVEDLQGSKLS
jgi:signal transduction histidine kinase